MSPSLFDPIQIRGLTVRNRLWVSPMCQYTIEKRDGVPTNWQLVHLGSFARGGAGLVMAEATAVLPEGRLSWKDTGLWNDEQRDAWRPTVEFVHEQGAAIGIQIAHAGRKACVWPEWERVDGVVMAKGQPAIARGTAPIEAGGWQTVGPSAVAFEGLAEPRELSRDEIVQTIDAFVASAVRAVEAGFDLIELHAAHGYLIHEFLSPISNLRTDDYGGSLENRARYLLELVDRVRAVIGDLPLFVRFSGSDWVEGGWTVEDTSIVAGWCAERGADFFDMSSGGSSRQQAITVGPGYQVGLARTVREQAGVPVAAVGLITDAVQADQIISRGDADAVMIGREFMRDPHFPLRAARELGVELDYWPLQYERARRA
jgi:2,4-dienoyl-CoA reductase-like NADH-dependent reductase (Old Yellow Enzyme family)